MNVEKVSPVALHDNELRTKLVPVIGLKNQEISALNINRQEVYRLPARNVALEDLREALRSQLLLAHEARAAFADELGGSFWIHRVERWFFENRELNPTAWRPYASL